MKNRDSDLPRVLAKYDRLVDWERRDRSAMKVDIAPLRDLLHQLNDPQKKFRTIHIAGTKGKGSVGALIEAGLHRGGLACGRFSSPHVEPEHTTDTVLRKLWRPLKLPPSSAENGELNAAIREAKSLSEFEQKSNRKVKVDLCVSAARVTD